MNWSRFGSTYVFWRKALAWDFVKIGLKVKISRSRAFIKVKIDPRTTHEVSEGE
jgi:hypothetical protein